MCCKCIKEPRHKCGLIFGQSFSETFGAHWWLNFKTEGSRRPIKMLPWNGKEIELVRAEAWKPGPALNNDQARPEPELDRDKPRKTFVSGLRLDPNKKSFRQACWSYHRDSSLIWGPLQWSLKDSFFSIEGENSVILKEYQINCFP